LITWLVILSRSRALDLLRRIRINVPRQNELSSDLLNHNPSVIQSFTHDRKILVEQLLDRLPKEQCSVIRKAHLEGYALAEIAAVEGVPLGTIKNRARFGLKKMRVNLEPGSALDLT
jgi:RNA polymerase sigma-70 factor (ECF subfamily)